MTPPLAGASVVAETAREFGLAWPDLTGPCRRSELVEARAFAAKRLYVETSLTLREIGLALGGRDHTTVRVLVAR